jgi:hypothetical protein
MTDGNDRSSGLVAGVNDDLGNDSTSSRRSDRLRWDSGTNLALGLVIIAV